jgi:hypothetical protein
MYIPVVPQETATDPLAWVRSSEWLPLPTVTAGDQKFVGLYAVWNSASNFVALTVAGRYTVNWGDGSAAEDIASGVSAEHNYVFSALAASTQVTSGYRQAIITVTMRLGDNLTSLNLQDIHSQSGLISGLNTCWLDIKHDGANMTTLTVGGVSPVVHRMLEQYEFVGSSSLTTAASKFSNCRKLGNLIGTSWTSGCTNFTSMFQTCTSLRTIPLLNTAAGTTFNGMFNGCASLQTIPLINTAAGTTTAFASMFQSCSSLQTIPLLNTAGGTSFSSMFLSCSSLQTIPLLNTAAGTDFTSMFNSCPSLRTIPLLNTAAGTTFSSMFSNCTSLQTIPLINTAAGTGAPFQNMFQTCTALQTIPLLNTAGATSFISMFQSCTSLQTIPLINTAGGTSFQNMFDSCSSLQAVPALVTTSGTSFTSMFNACPSLKVGTLTGTTRTISYASCELSGTELDAIYTALGDGTGQTITVTPNWGTATDTPSIATAKNWTVV